MSVAAVFFDKDGTLVEDVPYNIDPSRIALASGALAAAAALHARGFLIAVVTNQSGVALGKFEERALLPVERRLRHMLGAAGVPLAGMYWCPHHPRGVVGRYTMECACRKPQAGLLWRAAQEHDIDLARSWMVGDILDDIEAGRRAGCRTVLLDNGHETKWHLSRLRRPHMVAPTLQRAAAGIAAACDDEERSRARVRGLREILPS
jgi:D-glycero-D-manno-heptose 1,7-bisphosphate phosphatase